MSQAEAQTDTPAEAPPEAPIAERIAFERIALVYQLTPLPAASSAVFVAIVAAVFWNAAVPVSWLVAWVVLKLAALAVRATDTGRFEADPERLARRVYWTRRYLWLMTLDCLIWAAMIVVFGHTISGLTLTLVVAGLVGVASIGVFTTFSVFMASALFLLSLLGPMMVWFALQGTAAALGMAAGTLLYIGLLAFEAWRSEQRHIDMLRLRFENAAIADERHRALLLAEHSNRAKGRFLAAVSHEMRTPLNGIMGMSEIVRDGSAEPITKQRAGVILSSAEHLKRVIGDLLDLSRIEFGRPDLHDAPLDPRQALHEVTDLLAPVAAEKGLALNTRVEGSVPAQVSGDAARIKQVLHNLVGNAIKFTAVGRVDVELMQRAGGLVFSVHDTGPGIAPAHLESIFDAFEQAGRDAPGKQRAPRREGTGLGLTIARGLARAMGGDVRCTATPGQGSRFDFDLTAPTLQAAPAAAAAPPPALPHFEGRVLLVDDNEVNAMVAQAMLERLGFAVQRAGDGHDALLAMARKPFAVVLMDCRMPLLDGLEATRRWRRMETGARLPIIGVTANVSEEDRRECLDAGMDDFLPKPFQISELAAILAPHCGSGTRDRLAMLTRALRTASPPIEGRTFVSRD